MSFLPPAITIFLIGVANLFTKQIIIVDKKKYNIEERLEQDSIRSYEKVSYFFTKKIYLMERKKTKFRYESVEYYKEISHPNIIRPIAVDKLESQLCFIYPEKKTSELLHTCLPEIKDLKKLLGIFLGICEAVKYLNNINRVHTNITAETITLTKEMKPILLELTSIKQGTANGSETNVKFLKMILIQILESISYRGIKKLFYKDMIKLIEDILLAPTNEPSIDELIKQLSLKKGR